MPKVRVPQKDGEIRVSVDGLPAQTWSVDDHIVTTRSHADADLIVLHVDGAVPAVDDPPKTDAVDDPADDSKPQATRRPRAGGNA